MIYDNTLLFSDQQAITATAASTNVIDLGTTGSPFGGSAIKRDIGRGADIPVAVNVVQTFNNLTSIQISVQTSPDASTWTTIDSGRVVPLAELVAGYQFQVPSELPEGTNARYVRLNYTVAGAAPTLGKITAGVVAARQTNYTYGGN